MLLPPSAESGCGIVMFQDTYRNLTLRYAQDDAQYRGQIAVSCNTDYGWRGEQATATCLGADRWSISGCTSRLITDSNYIFMDQVLKLP